MKENENAWMMSEDDWKALIHAIRNENCILMLGPEIPAKGKNKPLMEILANERAKELSDKSKNLDRNNFASVAQKFCSEESRDLLEYKTIEFYEKYQSQPGDVHSDLAALPFYLIINASHDNLMFEALKQKKDKEPIDDWYNFRGDKVEMLAKTGTPKKPLVYCLYGSTKKSKSLVMTENDLLDFLVAVISTCPLPNNLKTEFEDKCFLFLGFGFRNWYLRILLHILMGEKKISSAFALEQFVPESDPNFQYTCIFVKDKYKIHVCKTNIIDFAKELRQRFEDESTSEQPASGSKAELLENAPTVFICHASEDGEHAKSLYDKLQNAGLKPWIDQEDIRGGDDWNERIKDTIDEIHYFVVLQSKAMQLKTKGYVNKEIHFAIERQPEFRGRFIFPVKIEECNLLKRLKKWQTLDLADTKKNNIAKLIKDIKRDYALRNE